MELDRMIDDLSPLVISWLARVAGALVVLVVAWMLSTWARRSLRRGLSHTRVDATLVKFVSSFTRWLILGLAFIACLTLFGIESTSFAAVIGAAGLAIGLALQGSLSHLASGLMLLLLRPFKSGDFVRVAGQLGTVDEIDLFMTTLDTPDNRRLVVPNSKVLGDVIENFSHHATRRIDVDVGCAYDADLDRTREVLEKAVQEVEGLLEEPAPQVVLMDLGASSVNWQVRVFAPAAELLSLKQALIRSVKNHLDGAQISIPFPQMDVHLQKGAVLQKQDAA